jgi:arylsulfatase A-like enzyme
VQGPLYLLYENEQWYPWDTDSEIVFFNKDVAKFPQDVSDKGPGPGDSNWDAQALGDKFSSKAVEFIKASAAKEKPFFLYYCASAVHVPHRPPVQLDGTAIKSSTPTPHLDMLTELDVQVKRIVDALKAVEQFENTLIVFTSDNGGLRDGKAEKLGYSQGGGWRGSKNTPFEGGHRVPYFAVWPGHIQPGVTDEVAVSQDMVATFAALVGTTIPDGQALDSLNLLPLLMGDDDFQGRDYFVNQAGSKQELMFRKMPWKLIIQSNFKRTKHEPLSLYNLREDPHEDHDMIGDAEFKSIVDSMFKEYMDIVQSERATVPGR